MLIRSQDKKSLYNLNTNKGIWINSARTKLIIVGEGFGELGNYSTEAKAIKVLDMIQKNYENLESLHHGFGVGDCCEVFQMPQDSEVEGL